MALIKCPECGKEASDKSTNCIHCGFPFNQMVPENTPQAIPVEKTLHLRPKRLILLVSIITAATLIVLVSIVLTRPCEHTWGAATLLTPPTCVKCGEENPVGLPRSTETLIGTWSVEHYYIDNEIISADLGPFEASFATDGTGCFIFNKQKYPVTWSFNGETEGALMYDVTMNGETQHISYVTDNANYFYKRIFVDIGDDIFVIIKKVS